MSSDCLPSSVRVLLPLLVCAEPEDEVNSSKRSALGSSKLGVFVSARVVCYLDVVT